MCTVAQPQHHETYTQKHLPARGAGELEQLATQYTHSLTLMCRTHLEAGVTTSLIHMCAQDATNLAGEAGELERRLAALQLFRREGDAGCDIAAVQRKLPLEPALALLRCVDF